MSKPSLRLAKGQRATPFATIDQAIEAFKAGQMLIVVDDEERENENNNGIVGYVAHSFLVCLSSLFGFGCRVNLS